MTRKELIYLVRRKTYLNEQQVSFILELIFSTILKEMKEGQEVKIHTFGTFKPTTVQNRKTMKFRTARLVKEYLNF